MPGFKKIHNKRNKSMRQELYAMRKYALNFARNCLFSVVIWGGGEGGRKCGSAWVGNDIEGEEIRHENKCV
jgi:hypothetical protein